MRDKTNFLQTIQENKAVTLKMRVDLKPNGVIQKI